MTKRRRHLPAALFYALKQNLAAIVKEVEYFALPGNTLCYQAGRGGNYYVSFKKEKTRLSFLFVCDKIIGYFG